MRRITRRIRKRVPSWTSTKVEPFAITINSHCRLRYFNLASDPPFSFVSPSKSKLHRINPIHKSVSELSIC